jgi:hypothetical protein
VFVRIVISSTVAAFVHFTPLATVCPLCVVARQIPNELVLLLRLLGLLLCCRSAQTAYMITNPATGKVEHNDDAPRIKGTH